MSQVADYVIANASGATVRADINTTLLAVVSNNSGSSEPGTMYAFMLWVDTTTNLIKLRNAANSAWITLGVSITASNTIDVNGGSIDGTPIGASSASTGAFTTLSATGASNLDSSVTINESGADVDFRVESDSSTHMLFVDGGNNRVGISGSVIVPTSILEVSEAVAASSGINSLVTISATDGGVNMGGGEGPGILFKIPDDETNPSVGAQIGAFKESSDDSVSNTGLAFSVSQNDETLDRAVTINSSGNVGIGGSVTNSVLDIHTAALTAKPTALRFTNAGDINYAWEFWRDNTDGDLRFGEEINGTHTTRVTFETGGNVGIGVTGPSSYLSNNLVVSAPNDGGITIASTNTTNGNYLSFADGTSGSDRVRGLVGYNHGTDFLFMQTDAVERLRILNNGELQLKGGTYLAPTGVESLAFTNGSFSVADNSTLTLTDIANTGCLVAIGQNRSSAGVTYDHCLVFAEHSTATTMVANPSGRFGTSSGTDTITNIYMSGASMIIENKVGSAVTYSVAIFRFLGN